jgi:hypothetical protein
MTVFGQIVGKFGRVRMYARNSSRRTWAIRVGSSWARGKGKRLVGGYSVLECAIGQRPNGLHSEGGEERAVRDVMKCFDLAAVVLRFVSGFS